MSGEVVQDLLVAVHTLGRVLERQRLAGGELLPQAVVVAGQGPAAAVARRPRHHDARHRGQPQHHRGHTQDAPGPQGSALRTDQRAVLVDGPQHLGGADRVVVLQRGVVHVVQVAGVVLALQVVERGQEVVALVLQRGQLVGTGPAGAEAGRRPRRGGARAAHDAPSPPRRASRAPATRASSAAVAWTSVRSLRHRRNSEEQHEERRRHRHHRDDPDQAPQPRRRRGEQHLLAVAVGEEVEDLVVGAGRPASGSGSRPGTAPRAGPGTPPRTRPRTAGT